MEQQEFQDPNDLQTYARFQRQATELIRQLAWNSMKPRDGEPVKKKDRLDAIGLLAHTLSTFPTAELDTYSDELRKSTTENVVRFFQRYPCYYFRCPAFLAFKLPKHIEQEIHKNKHTFQPKKEWLYATKISLSE